MLVRSPWGWFEVVQFQCVETAEAEKEYDEFCKRRDEMFARVAPKMSAMPENDGMIQDNEFEESDVRCDNCGAYMWQRVWWDDPPEHGGAPIGTQYACGDCGYFYSK